MSEVTLSVKGLRKVIGKKEIIKGIDIEVNNGEVYVSLIIFIFTLLSYLISGTVFGFGGWTAPVLTGFAVEGGQLQEWE